MPVRKYDAYLAIGNALKSRNKKNASIVAQIVIKSDRKSKSHKYLSDKLVLSRQEKKILQKYVK